MLSWDDARIQLPVHYPWNTSMNVCRFLLVLRIRDVYPRSRLRFFPSRIRFLPSLIPGQIFSIPDPRSRVDKIPDTGSGSASKNLRIFNSKIRSRNVHPRSRILYPGSVFFSFRIPDPGVKKEQDPDPQHCFLL
jgi:hypothetical protein